MIFVNNFSPYIFSFEVNGHEFGLRWYGLAYVIGFALGFFAMRKAVLAGRIRGMHEKHLDAFLWVIVIGVIGGGRLGYCLQHIDYWLTDPLFLFKITEGGMAFFGGLAGVVLATLWFCRKNKIKFADIGDTLTIPAAIALGLGRIANFINAELWGVPTGADWGVIYPHLDQVPRHPSELYESASHFLLAVVLWGCSKTSIGRKPGGLSAVFVLFYGIFRTVTEKFRTTETYVGPLTNGQVASLILAAIGLILVIVIAKRSSESRTATDENA